MTSTGESHRQVAGAWSLEHGRWRLEDLENGRWRMVAGEWRTWSMVARGWSLEDGRWSLVARAWSLVDGRWRMELLEHGRCVIILCQDN